MLLPDQKGWLIIKRANSYDLLTTATGAAKGPAAIVGWSLAGNGSM
jgi:hypothetical protein